MQGMKVESHSNGVNGTRWPTAPDARRARDLKAGEASRSKRRKARGPAAEALMKYAVATGVGLALVVAFVPHLL